MNALRSCFLCACTLLLISGCSTGPTVSRDYDSETGKTIYQTRSYTVSTLSGSNIGSSKSISMQAIGQCLGQGCQPNMVQFVFSATGNQRLQLSGLDGQIVADGTRITWSTNDAAEGYQNPSEEQAINVVGRFAAVDVSLDQLSQIATASSVDGSIGGQSLRLGSGIQTSFRTLLQKIEGPSSQP